MNYIIIQRYEFMKVYYIAVGDGILDVPKRHRYIKHKFDILTYPNNTHYYKFGA